MTCYHLGDTIQDRGGAGGVLGEGGEKGRWGTLVGEQEAGRG